MIILDTILSTLAKVAISKELLKNAHAKKHKKAYVPTPINISNKHFIFLFKPAFTTPTFDKLTAIIISFGNLEYKRIFQSPKIHADKRYNTI